MLRKLSWLFSATVLCVACGEAIEPEPVLDNNALMLAEPEAFDIGMDPNLFTADVLEQYPDVTACHTQGLELVGDQIYLSCTLFGSTADRDRCAKRTQARWRRPGPKRSSAGYNGYCPASRS